MGSAAVALPTTTTNAIYLVATDRGDDAATAVILEAGLRLAREAGARVVLYDRSAESWFTDPFEAVAWAGGQAPSWDQLLSPHELRHLGYGYLAEQLLHARAMRLDAKAWLPFGVGPVAMARCCAAWGVTHVVLSATVADPSWRARLRGHTLAAFQAGMLGVEILLVDPDGRVRGVSGPTGQSQPIRTDALV